MAIRKANKNLIIVPGHSVCINPDVPEIDTSWIDIIDGEAPLYIEHIKEGVRQAAEDDNAMLVFSGGQTREKAGSRSEAESYYEIAARAGWWNHHSVSSRAAKEEFARDSFENLLFSISLFKREQQTWPGKVTVVGWEFKAARYSLHRQAIRWPMNKFVYIGINNPYPTNLQKALDIEKAKIASTEKDFYVRGAEWSSQRAARDPFNRRHPYHGIDAQLDELFHFLDAATYTGEFPWL